MKKTVCVALAAVIVMLFCSCGNMKYDENTKQYYDEHSNIVRNLSAPYFYYDDAEVNSGWKLPENAEFPHSQKRVAAKDNPDYLITENDESVCINEYVGEDSNVVIPATLNGKKVTKIGGYTINSENGEGTNFLPAFNVSKIKSLYIPKYVKSVANLNLSAVLGYDWYSEKCILNKITVDKDNEYYSSDDSTLYNNNGETALLYFGNGAEDSIIPSKATAVESSFLQSLFSNHKISNTLTVGKNIKKFGNDWYSLSDICIKGYRGSAAEKLAEECDLDFVALD